MIPLQLLVDTNAVLKAVIALFIIVDPFGNIPIFIGLTQSMDPEKRRKTFQVASITAAILLIAFALTGKVLLTLFGVEVRSFMIAGGTLLLILAVKILVHGTWEEKVVSSESAGAVPIAFPLLVGPGAITTTIVSLETGGFVTTIISVAVVLAITWAALRSIERIYRFLGTTGSAVIARLMAVFIAAIAFEYIIEGIKFYFP